MANTNAPMGFELFTGGGVQPRRVRRYVDGGTATTLAPGDAYALETDGAVVRCDGSGVAAGIVEAIELKEKDGPLSYDYLPASTAGYIIGIEDHHAEFIVQIDTVAEADFDQDRMVDIVDAAANAALRQSRQYVTLSNGSQLQLVRMADIVGNELGAYCKVVVRLLEASVA